MTRKCHYIDKFLEEIYKDTCYNTINEQIQNIAQNKDTL